MIKVISELTFQFVLQMVKICPTCQNLHSNEQICILEYQKYKIIENQ